MPRTQPRFRDPLAAAAILLAFAADATAGSAQEPASAAAPRPALTDAQKERFLLQAKVVRRRSAPGGLPGTERATLALDGLEHDAHVQAVEGYDLKVEPTGGSEIDLLDSWRYNVAAYRIDRLLGLRMVPVTVERRDELKEASFTWWVDGFLMDEKARLRKKAASPDPEAWDAQMNAVRIFDQLIENSGRGAANLLIDEDWCVWLIDHSRAFKVSGRLKSPKSLGPRCPRGLLARLRALDKSAIERSMAGVLDTRQIDGLLARRDAIVRYFDEQIAASGEAAVLYDLPSRSEATAATP